MKRFLVATMVLGVLLGGVIPVAGAAPTDSMNVFEGTGSATALDLSMPGLLGVAKTAGDQTLIDAAKKFPGLTVGHTFSSFKVDGVKSTVSANGGAAPDCDLLTRNVDPLKICSSADGGDAGEVSAAPGSLGGDDKASCTDVSLLMVSFASACGKSFSSITDGRPVSINEATVITGSVLMDLSSLNPELEANKDALLSTLQTFVVSNLNSVSTGADITDSVKADITSKLDSYLSTVASIGRVADIKLGPSTVVVGGIGDITTITSKAAGGTVELLGIPVGNAFKYLITIEVSHSIATASWDRAKGLANATAQKALATVRISDLANLCSVVELNLPCENGYIKLVVNGDQGAVDTILGTLNTIDLLHTTVNVGPDTKEQTGKSVVATASGVEIHALKGLGQSADGKLDGGIDLRIATAGVTLQGDNVRVEASTLPLTGGPTYLYIGAALLLAGAAVGLYRWSSKLRTAA
ncbi:MAG: hypothetical protein ABIS18_05150 [Actinomycetota bacterium]